LPAGQRGFLSPKARRNMSISRMEIPTAEVRGIAGLRIEPKDNRSITNLNLMS
jgi:hypothetical protein